MKKGILFAGVLSLFAFSSPAWATALAPGGTAVPAATVESGTVVASSTTTYSFGGGADTGTVRQEVVVQAGGNLDFLYQVSVAKGDVATLSGSNFSDGVSFSTDVYEAASTSGVTGNIMATGTQKVAPNADSRSASGKVVNFPFSSAVGVGVTSFVEIVKTNATTFDSGGNTGFLDDSPPGSASPFFEPAGSPTPEPSTFVLLSGTMIGLGVGAYRRRKNRIAKVS